MLLRSAGSWWRKVETFISFDLRRWLRKWSLRCGGRESEGGFEAGAVLTELRREAHDLWWCCGASAGSRDGAEDGREVVAPWCAGWMRVGGGAKQDGDGHGGSGWMRVTADWWCSGCWCVAGNGVMVMQWWPAR